MERRFSTDTIGVRLRRLATRTIEGHAAVYYDGTSETEFNLGGMFVERIMPGAFDRAAREDDVRALYNHDPSALLGRISAGTLRLSTDKRGLLYSIDLPDSATGKDVAEAVARGDLTGSSFGFEVTDQNWRTESGQDIREIRGVKLWDVGPVTFPAYEGTDVQTASAACRQYRDRRELDEYLARINAQFSRLTAPQ